MAGSSVSLSMVVVGTWSNMLQPLLRVSRDVNFRSKSLQAVLTFWHCLHSAVHRPSAWLHMIFVIACFLPSIRQKFTSTLLKLESSNSCLISILFTPFFLSTYPTFNGNVPELTYRFHYFLFYACDAVFKCGKQKNVLCAVWPLLCHLKIADI